MICIVIIAISAGSRVLARVFSAPEKRAFRARNLFFFVSLSREMFGSTQLSCGVIWFLCNHKHIQSFVNSVLIIAKTLSLSPSLARAFSIEASYRERERERKKEREKEIYNITFFFLVRKKRRSRRKKEGKEKDLKRDGENPDTKDDTKSSSSLVLFLFLFRYCNEEEEHRLEKTLTEKRSIQKGSE